MCLTMATVLALHAPHLPVWLSVGLAIVLGLRWWHRRHAGKRLPWWLRLPPTLLLPLLVIAHYGTIFGRAPGSALAVGLLVLKLLESERARDARTGVAFACFGLMSALLFSQSLVSTAVVALGLIPALATLRALEPARETPSWSGEWLPVVRTLALALPLALAAFLFVPRLGSPLWGAPGSQVAKTGVSGRMAPGDFTQLLIDDRPAFRVSFDGAPPPPAQRYFRGPVLWWFDGRTWEGRDPRVASASAQVVQPETLQVTGGTYSYDISLEATRRHWLFALDTPLAAPPGSTLTIERNLVSAKSIDDTLHYHARSATGHVLAAQLDNRERRLGLMLPAGFDPQAHALARSWRQKYGSDNAAIVRAALNLFHDGGFNYTLTPPPLGRDSVDDFLFSTKAGFCEHYSSAFTFLMRAAGIPARVVTGYQGGFWNPYAHYLLVRNSDAHAWSEVWLAGNGWTRVDPTAAVRPQRITYGAAAAASSDGTDGGWLLALSNRWDIVNRWWGQAVIGFDALRQRGLLTPFGIRDADSTRLTIALAISIGVMMLLALAWTLLQRRRYKDAIGASMGLLQRRLARAGIPRRPTEGPRHFFTRAMRALPRQRKALRKLGHAYEQLRYAQADPPAESIHAFRRAVRDFRPHRVVK